MSKVILFLSFCLLSFQYANGQNCISIDQSELAKSINEFRTLNGSQALNLSAGICLAAVSKAKSLQESGQSVNLSSEFYTRNEKMINLKVKGIYANSQNTLPTLTMKNAAIEFWKVILEEESFADRNWKSFGVGLYQNYAVLWFSDKVLIDKPPICGDESINAQTEIIIGPKNELPAINGGNWLVEPKYYKMGVNFTENGFYPVANDSEKWGYINKENVVVIPFQFQNAYGFSEGLASVELDDKYGYINENGEFEIAPNFSYGRYFNNGIALIGQDGLEYLINRKGEKITEGSSDLAMLNDNYIAYKNNGLYGIKDLSGKILKAPFMSDFYGYSDGLAGVKIQGKWGFMDENFKIVITPKYTEKLVYAFQNGCARVKQNGKVGMIDKTGKLLIDPAYDEIYELSEGLIAFLQNGKWGYMNLNKEVVIQAQYFSANNFKNGLAKVKTEPTNCHLIDQNNNRIISDVYDLVIFSKNLIGVNAGQGWGIVQLNDK